MSVDKDTVRRIAKLARLAVPENRLEPMAGELNGIFQWVEMLSEVNVEGVPAMTTVVAQKLKWRDDKVTDGGQADALMTNAPDRRRRTSSWCPRWSNNVRPDFHDPGRGARRASGPRRFPPRELTGAFVKAIEEARAAQCLHHRDARSRRWRWPTPSDARIATGEVRRAGRPAAGDQGSVLHQGHAHHRRQQDPGQFRAAL